ncbi:32331_t:CDS:2, partial [Racocetra persica]
MGCTGCKKYKKLFLSGIAPQAVVTQKQASTILFYFWKLCASLFQLLISTGGLPHALERLLIICFRRLYDGEIFFKELKNHDYSSIYKIVKEDLQMMHNIYADMNKNKNLAIKLLYHCVEGIPVTDKTCLDEKNPHLTIENQQQLMNKVFRINNHMHWQDWELFVLYHEAFCTNLTIETGISGMNLGQLYPGTYREDIYLQIYVVLKRLHCYEANEQFLNNKKLTNKYDNKSIDLESGTVVVLNNISADFTDIILVRMNGEKCLLIIQCKWDYIDDDDIKNLSKHIAEFKKIYEGYELITIIFTTQPYSGPQEKVGILIISKDNFDKHFGPVFLSLATFSLIKAINPNFWDVNRLKNIFDDIGDASIENVIEKRP